MYISSQNTTHNAPKAIGGSANEKLESTSSAVVGEDGATKTSYHVSPTHTVARRADDDAPAPTDFPTIPYSPASFSSDRHLVRAVPPSRHRRALHHNRSLD